MWKIPYCLWQSRGHRFDSDMLHFDNQDLVKSQGLFYWKQCHGGVSFEFLSVNIIFGCGSVIRMLYRSTPSQEHIFDCYICLVQMLELDCKIPAKLIEEKVKYLLVYLSIDFLSGFSGAII